MIFRFGELFCGPGGIGLAAKRSTVKKDGEVYSISHAWANDIDPDACATYRLNICPANPKSVIEGPVEQLDIDGLEPIDSFAFGFPCNDFSVVGEQNGMSGEYGPLYTYGVRVLDAHNPSWFLAENVGGLQSADDGRTFLKILTELEAAGAHGYQLTTHLYKFEEYAVPQTRHRIIIVGMRRDLDLEFRVPAPTTPKPEDYKTARGAIEEPPIPVDAPNNELTNHDPRVVERLDHIPEGENAWFEGLPEHLRLNVEGAKLSQIYRRLEADKPSYTVTGSGGGGTHVYHWEESRALTNRERARLQTFPDDFVFIGGKGSVRKQIGMAVPPDAAQVIIEAVLKTFANKDYPSVPAKWGVEERETHKTQMVMEI